MKKAMIEMILGIVHPNMIAEIVCGILWELAKLTDNTLDDDIVRGIAKHFGIDDPSF